MSHLSLAQGGANEISLNPIMTLHLSHYVNLEYHQNTQEEVRVTKLVNSLNLWCLRRHSSSGDGCIPKAAELGGKNYSVGVQAGNVGPLDT